MDAIQAAYHNAKGNPSDIWQHVETLYSLAILCNSAMEIVSRPGESTTAFLAARSLQKFDCFTSKDKPELLPLFELANKRGCKASYQVQDSLSIQLQDLQPADLLFIDTFKTYTRMKTELSMFGELAKKYLVFHDTVVWGDQGEDGSKGIWPAIAEFVRNNPHWQVLLHHTFNNGLTVLQREGKHEG